MRRRASGHDEAGWELEAIRHTRELETEPRYSRSNTDVIDVTVVVLGLAVTLLRSLVGWTIASGTWTL